MPQFNGDSGTPYSINQQNSPTASFHHGHYLLTLIKNNLASMLLHQEKCVRNFSTGHNYTLATVPDNRGIFVKLRASVLDHSLVIKRRGEV
jgi:hypothetical protein